MGDLNFILERLRTDGFFYQPSFAAPESGLEHVMQLASRLGNLWPDIVLTQPTPDAPAWRPFDRAEVLGWHNDFTSHAERPEYSLSFIERADPRGRPWGDWRVARVADVIAALGKTAPGRQAVEILTAGAKPFEFDGDVYHFPVFSERDGTTVVRFYGEALRRGCVGRPDASDVVAAVKAVETVADQCCVELHARAGALLVVDNWVTLHYRREQSVDLAPTRRAVLAFAGRRSS